MAAAEQAVASPEKPQRGTRQYQEESLLRSLMNCPLCKGKQVVACFKDCRYQDGLGWKTCLTRCLNNPLILDMFLGMLPDEEETVATAAASKSGVDQEGDLSASQLLRGLSGTEAA